MPDTSIGGAYKIGKIMDRLNLLVRDREPILIHQKFDSLKDEIKRHIHGDNKEEILSLLDKCLEEIEDKGGDLEFESWLLIMKSINSMEGKLEEEFQV